MSYEEQIMSKDKYTSIFSPQMEAIVYIILQIFYAMRAVLKIGKYPPIYFGSRVGAVVRALAFHQCVPGSIPGPGVICGLSLLVLYSAPRGFSPGTPVFPSPQKPTFDLFDLFDLIYLIYSLPN